MRARGIFVVIALSIVTAACNTRPQAPEFIDSTTTTTTLPSGSVATTTQPTLPPIEERVTGTVIDVIDGDTVEMTIEGTPTTVRLLGINAPERTECWGDEATVILSNLVLGRELLVVSGEEDLDGFGRALRFLYLEDGNGVEFVNGYMVAEGSAVAIQNGNPYAADLKASEARAYQSGKGMWGTYACGSSEGLEADRPVIRVSEISYDPPGPDDDAMSSEYVTIVNEGYGRVSIAGWVLRDESSSNRFTFAGGTVLAVGESITVVTGCDGGPSNSVYWCSDTPVWSNGGDTVIVNDTLGNAVIWYSYSGSNP